MSKINLNTVVVSGYVADNVTVNQNRTVLSFGLGIDDSYYDKQKNGGEWVNRTCWINCKVFDKNRIERLDEIGLAGNNVVINGQLKTNSYTDSDGQKKTFTYVLAQRIQIVPSGDNSGSGNANNGNNNNNQDDGGYINMDGIDDELPFN